MSPDPPVVAAMAADPRDRRGLLLFFGIVEILIGACSAGLACLVILAGSLAGRPAPDQGPALDPSALMASAVLYAGAAAFFVVIGIGTIRAQRWARAIMLVVAWPWLLGMVFVTFLIGVTLRPLLASLPMPQGTAAPAGALVAVLVIVGALLSLLPLALILFYGGRNVRWTFATADPRPCWTDGRPLPVLAVALVMLASALGSLLGIGCRAVALFGWVITGWPAVAAYLALACAFAWLGRELYRMTLSGWWANVWFAVLLHVSWGLTMSRIGSEGLLASLHLDAAQRTALSETGLLATFASPWLAAASAAAWIGVLVALRKHYNTKGPRRDCPP